jgi:hypothetical protein
MTLNIFKQDDLYICKPNNFIGVKDTFFQRFKKKLRDKRSMNNYLKNKK